MEGKHVISKWKWTFRMKITILFYDVFKKDFSPIVLF